MFFLGSKKPLPNVTAENPTTSLPLSTTTTKPGLEIECFAKGSEFSFRHQSINFQDYQSRNYALMSRENIQHTDKHVKRTSGDQVMTSSLSTVHHKDWKSRMNSIP